LKIPTLDDNVEIISNDGNDKFNDGSDDKQNALS